MLVTSVHYRELRHPSELTLTAKSSFRPARNHKDNLTIISLSIALAKSILPEAKLKLLKALTILKATNLSIGKLFN